MELDKQIWKYVADNLLYVDDPFEYDNDTSFIEEGLIDSTGVMELVMYVQSAFDITVEPHDVTPEVWRRIRRLEHGRSPVGWLAAIHAAFSRPSFAAAFVAAVVVNRFVIPDVGGRASVAATERARHHAG